jgi:hypothetical protein
VWNAKYVIKERLPTDPSHYVKQFIYGIIEASTTLNYTYTVWEALKTIINTTDTTNSTNSTTETNSTAFPAVNVTYGNFATLDIVLSCAIRNAMQ